MRYAVQPGRQLDVADPRAVDERLVDAVGGGVERGGGDVAVECDRAGELVGGPLARREVVGLDRRDPLGGPVEVEGVAHA